MNKNENKIFYEYHIYFNTLQATTINISDTVFHAARIQQSTGWYNDDTKINWVDLRLIGHIDTQIKYEKLLGGWEEGRRWSEDDSFGGVEYLKINTKSC